MFVLVWCSLPLSPILNHFPKFLSCLCVFSFSACPVLWWCLCAASLSLTCVLLSLAPSPFYFTSQCHADLRNGQMWDKDTSLISCVTLSRSHDHHGSTVCFTWYHSFGCEVGFHSQYSSWSTHKGKYGRA